MVVRFFCSDTAFCGTISLILDASILPRPFMCTYLGIYVYILGHLSVHKSPMKYTYLILYVYNVLQVAHR